MKEKGEAGEGFFKGLADYPVRIGEDSWDFDSQGNPWFIGLTESGGVRLVKFADGQWIPFAPIYNDRVDTLLLSQGIVIDENNTFHVMLAGRSLSRSDDKIVLYGYGVPQDVEESPASPSLSLVPLLGPNLAFKLSVPKPGFYSLELYDGGGRLVRKLFEGELTPGWHRMSFGARLPKGVYFLRLSGEGLGAVNRLVVP